jgi:hypothetical protein
MIAVYLSVAILFDWVGSNMAVKIVNSLLNIICLSISDIDRSAGYVDKLQKNKTPFL